jgi:DNA adenine methylase
MEPKNSVGRSAAKPFLRWAGGKWHLVRRLLDFVPKDLESRIYREPFLGAGSLFFALQPKKAALSDANEHLIRCYEHVRDDWKLVARYLRQHRSSDCESHYYRIRDVYNSSSFSPAQAARLIYLNKACFNGIFRVNQKGTFNVPYGRKNPPALPNGRSLKAASHALRSATLSVADYREALAEGAEGDFVYLDPPYPPLNGTAYFTHYTQDRFNKEDQEELADWVHKLDKLGCLVMMTNADTPVIRSLYSSFSVVPTPVTRFLTCKPERHTVNELIITNYQLTAQHERGSS